LSAHVSCQPHSHAGFDSSDCPLCSGERRAYADDARRRYWQCDRCQLVWADPSSRLSPAAERVEYEKHENVATDAGYRAFVSRLVAPLQLRQAPPARVLDFGAGRSSALAALFRESGYAVRVYDPFFAPDPTALRARYDLICLCEVLEHVDRPRGVLQRLWACLDPGGILGIQTQRLISRERFKSWRYKDDPTHVAFYSDATLSVVASHLGAKLELLPRDVALLSKPLG